MAEAVSSGVPPVTPPPASADEQTIYRAGGGRRVAFSFIFLLLLPFFASLPAMLYQRVASGLWFDTLALAIMATGFTILMGLILVELLASIRTRVELAETSVKMTLPAGRGPTPKLRYRTLEVPYTDIGAIETRREIYGGSTAPVLLKGSRILTKDGRSIPLGYVSEANTDQAFPFIDIAHQIATRAGVQVFDRGSVWRSARHKMMGIKSADKPVEAIDEETIANLNARHHRLVLGLILALVAMVGIGITLDLVDEWGSLSPQTVTAAPATK